MGPQLLVVSVAVALLRLVLKGWHQAAVAVTVVTAVVFAFGHVERAIDGRLGEQALFSASVVIAVVGVWLAIRSPSLIARSAPFLNVSVAILLLVQITTLAGGSWRADLDWMRSEPSSESLPTSHLFDRLPPIAAAGRPDIYYIILDAYGRHDALGDFDNSEFLEALEARGFSVALEATSNYRSSMQSLASSLNLEYLDSLGNRTPRSKGDIARLVEHNALATILKRLGYTYVHLESGWGMTDKSPLADVGLTFTPAGVLTSIASENAGISYGEDAAHAEGFVEGTFTRELLSTTLVRVLVLQSFPLVSNSPYQWWAPERALQMFEFLSGPIQAPEPKFVFAHILKPHKPAVFDRHGNMFLSKGGSVGFSDSHDGSVPDAYIGQLIYTNTLVLRAIDGILENSKNKPIIVIAADHGRLGESRRHATLAAFHLPNAGDNALYSSISSVNHFRYILDRYFGLGLGLLEDRQISHESDEFDFTQADRSVHR